MESRKTVLKDLFIYGETDRVKTYGHVERGGEGEMLERVTWKLTLPYVK